MINKEDFIKRLDSIIAQYEESASSFAEVINVPRSSISHIMSGRNNPSLDFIMKIINAYPDVNLYWLLYGSENDTTKNIKHDKGNYQNLTQPETAQNNAGTSTPSPSVVAPSTKNDLEIDKIVIFYSDGTFRSFIQNK